ncbi:MAG: cytochrome c1 [Alphaproteobacteria bacterium]|nr:cytochrome c1 [Alphaproteobacteria bacterium]
MKKTLLFSALLLTLSSQAFAAEEIALPKQHWPHKSLFGAYDKAAVQRGFQVYKEVRSSCHAMKFLSYRNLGDLGYTPDEVKAVAAQYTVTDGPNDDGEMFERTALPSDPFKSPFKNDKAARAANNGALPPDMSLLVKAREGAEDYIFGVLTGFEDAPAGLEMQPGMNYNKYFPGHQIAMAKPLADGQVSYSDGTGASLEQEARDVTQFLAWASEPHMEQRKQTGLKVILFLLAFAGIMYKAKKKIWAQLK